MSNTGKSVRKGLESDIARKSNKSMKVFNLCKSVLTLISNPITTKQQQLTGINVVSRVNIGQVINQSYSIAM